MFVSLVTAAVGTPSSCLLEYSQHLVCLAVLFVIVVSSDVVGVAVAAFSLDGDARKDSGRPNNK